ADALHPARDRGGRFHLDDEVDRPHVDAELERARRDERGEPARLEVVLDAEALLARDRTVVRVYELLAGELVERRGEPLREASRIHEDQGRAVRADQLEQPWMDRWPDRGALHRRDGTARDLRGLASSGRCVADSPTRWSFGAPAPRSSSRRSSVSARCEPRLLGTTAWISSTITVSTRRNASRARLVSTR